MKELDMSKLNAFVQGADNGSGFDLDKELGLKKKPKVLNSTTPLSAEQFDFIQEIKGHLGVSVVVLLEFVWNYQKKNKINLSEYFNLYPFLTQRVPTADKKCISFTRTTAVQEIRKRSQEYKSSVIGMNMRSTILLLVLHYAKNELNYDVSKFFKYK